MAKKLMQVPLDDDQKAFLVAEAQRTDRSMSDVVRVAIDALGKAPESQRDEAMHRYGDRDLRKGGAPIRRLEGVPGVRAHLE